MSDFLKGDVVGVRCDVQPGPFDEKLVTVETDEGPICGFVKPANLDSGQNGDKGLVKGLVVSTAQASIEVRIFGSFFTTALGLASIPRRLVSAAV